jgi:hypothetical protein
VQTMMVCEWKYTLQTRETLFKRLLVYGEILMHK